MNDEKISIIIPIYNVEKYLKKCIESVLKQTYKNIEIILVNDASVDNSDKICKKYEKKDNRIKYISRKFNGGLSASRNTGIEASTGKYLYFLDGDDSITFDAIDFLYNLTKKYDSDITIGNIQEICENGNLKNVIQIESEKKYNEIKFSNIEALEAMLYNSTISNSACNKLFKKDLFDNIEFPVGKHYEDLGTTYKLIAKSKIVIVSKKNTYLYLINRNGSIMNSKYTSKRLEGLVFTEEILSFVKVNFPSIEKAAINRLYMECIYILINIPFSRIYYDDRKKIKCLLRKYRYSVIFNKKMPKKQKFLAVVSIFGKIPLMIVWNMKEKILRG